MTFEDFTRRLLQCDSPATCDEFLRKHLFEIRPLFYGLTRQTLNERRFQYADAFYQFANSAGSPQTKGAPCPKAVLALLVLFMSLFERARLFPALLAVSDMLPGGSLRSRAEAIFQYKNITDASSDYTARFDHILSLLESACRDANESVREQCDDLLVEYLLEAVLQPRGINIEQRAIVQALFRNPETREKYPLLRSKHISRVLALDDGELANEALATRTRIVEAFHAEACALVPAALLVQTPEEHVGEEQSEEQRWVELPRYVDDCLTALGAHRKIDPTVVKTGLKADEARNKAYLGTYFPRSLIECQNILSEVLSIPVVERAFAEKDVVRILDIGSGTGGSSAGAILALEAKFGLTKTIELTSVDGNENALRMQKQVLLAMGKNLGCRMTTRIVHRQFSTNLDSFIQDFQELAGEEGRQYDIVLFWKHLSEYYNTNYAQANGIVAQALRIASTLIVPRSVCCVLDVTSSDNQHEFFPSILNREANQYEATAGATLATVLPVPCARNSRKCQRKACFMQRVFAANHRLCQSERSKVVYRVLAPIQFAASIVNTFTLHNTYRINAQRPHEACRDGTIGCAQPTSPSGFTGFFTGEKNK